MYSLMLFGFTPKIGFVSRVFFAAVFHEVHSPGVKIEGTSSDLILLKSQLFPKDLIMILRAWVLSRLSLKSFCKSSFDFVALRTQMWSRARGWSALTAILRDICLTPFFLPKLMKRLSFSTFVMIPTPHVL